MRAMNEFLATGPFDLYELQLFHLVAEHQNFTKAGRAAGLTQSAITRQIRGMEDRLGLALFERTTRHVRLTAAGAALHARSGAILSEVNDAISVLKDGFSLAPKALRVGIGRTIGLAYLPGFSAIFRRSFQVFSFAYRTSRVRLFWRRLKAENWTLESWPRPLSFPAPSL
jgi:DNA-binding transcriptional LysR family regulator